MTEEKAEQRNVPETSLTMQQIGILNFRINDFMRELNATIKMLVAENETLKKENAELKAEQEKQANLDKTVKAHEKHG